jgi:hypothetical protein
MYEVRVIRLSDEIVEAKQDFPFWDEIGLWLAKFGYNTSQYKVEIRFVKT